MNMVKVTDVHNIPDKKIYMSRNLDLQDATAVPPDKGHIDADLAKCEFHIKYLIDEFLIHVALPLCWILPYITVARGVEGFNLKTYLQNRQILFNNSQKYVTVLQWLIYSLVVIMNVIFVVDKPEHVSSGELLIVNAIFLIRCFVIATKYGFTTSKEYSSMLKKSEPVSKQAERQVITGWANANPELVKTQILYAAIRKRLDLGSMNFGTDINSQLHDLNVLQIAADIANASIKHVKTNSLLILVLSFVPALLPILIRIASGIPAFGGTTWSAYLFTISGVISTVFLMTTNILFLHVANVDVQRRSFMIMRWFNVLVEGSLILPNDPIEISKLDHFQALLKIPKLDMENATNIRKWWFVRIVFLDFGKPFYDRLSAYTAYFMLFELTLILLIFVQSTLIPDLMKFEIQMLVAYYLVWINSYLIQTIISGSLLNRHLESQPALIMKKVIEMEFRVSSNTQATTLEKEKAEDTISCMTRIKSGIQAFYEVQYISFLGVKASVTFINSIGALFLSGISTLVNLIARK